MQSENVINSLNKSLTSESDDDVFEEFAARIQTYIDGQKWIKKPSVLSPTICAQYGWKCIKSDLLECVTCGAKLSAYEPKIGNYEAYKACVEKIISSLKDNHGKHCPWPLTPSPENFVRMTLMPKEEALSQFLKRVETSLFFQTSFPKIKESVISHLGLNDQQIMTLCKMAGVNPEEASCFGNSIVLLCVTGWIVTEDLESNKHVLKCKNCLRSAWCGSFSLLNSEDNLEKKIESSELDIPNANSDNSGCDISEDNKENSDEPPLKKKRTSFIIKKGEPFDPLHEHRPWCLWIHYGTDSYVSGSKDNASKNNNSSNIPGWKIYLKSLLRNVSDNQVSEVRESPSKEQIRNVRNLLEKWTDAL